MLEEPEIREGVKVFSNWPTIPQLYIRGEFIGGCDIMREDEAHSLWEQTEVAWGTGFRYLIARQYGLHTGIDIAFSEHEQALYFNVGSGL